MFYLRNFRNSLCNLIQSVSMYSGFNDLSDLMNKPVTSISEYLLKFLVNGGPAQPIYREARSHAPTYIYHCPNLGYGRALWTMKDISDNFREKRDWLALTNTHRTLSTW